MRLWFLSNPARLNTERQAITALLEEGWFTNETWDLKEGLLTITGIITAHEHSYPVRLVYPDQFPEVPAWVEPQEPARWSSHQYRDGSLCLELRPDNWTPAASGADVLRSAFNLIYLENPLGKEAERATAPSDHQFSEAQLYGFQGSPVLMSAGCLARLQAGDAEEVKGLRWFAKDGLWPIMIHDHLDRTGPFRPPKGDILSLREDIPALICAARAPADPKDRLSLFEMSGLNPSVWHPYQERATAIVVFLGDLTPVAFHLNDQDQPYQRPVYVLPEQSGLRSGRPPTASAKRVSIVGAGSVGSKIAESLIRSGIANLTIVDGDVMLPGNLERHVLDWRDIGFRKAKALKERLLQIAPGSNICALSSNLNWQRAADFHADIISAIASGDLIVDATGDPATSLLLGALAAENYRPFVSVEVYEGGIGACIASCVPKRDPSYAQARAAYNEWCEQQGVKPPESGERRYEALAPDGTPVIADDAAVTTAAGHATRVILDILDGTPAEAEAAWLLLGFRKAWLFERHGSTISWSAQTPALEEKPKPEYDPETLDFITRLLKLESADESSAESRPDA